MRSGTAIAALFDRVDQSAGNVDVDIVAVPQ